MITSLKGVCGGAVGGDLIDQFLMVWSQGVDVCWAGGALVTR